MIAVTFEVLPAEGHYSRYLELAAALKPQLTNIDGFISIERFQSISEPKKILSLSFWRDEAAVQQWRNQELHRSVQQQGRSSVFTDYRLRVASVIRDYGMFDREQAPQDSRDAHKENAHE